MNFVTWENVKRRDFLQLWASVPEALFPLRCERTQLKYQTIYSVHTQHGMLWWLEDASIFISSESRGPLHYWTCRVVLHFILLPYFDRSIVLDGLGLVSKQIKRVCRKKDRFILWRSQSDLLLGFRPEHHRLKKKKSTQVIATPNHFLPRELLLEMSCRYATAKTNIFFLLEHHHLPCIGECLVLESLQAPKPCPANKVLSKRNIDTRPLQVG